MSTTARLLAAVPYLLGFRPAQSLVLLGLSDSDPGLSTIRVTVRVDLPDSELDVGELGTLTDALSRAGATGCVAIVYADAVLSQADAFAALLQPLRLALGRCGVQMVDEIGCAGDRWRSLPCDDTTCCPPAGRPIDPGQVMAVAAEAVGLGLVAAPDRDALQAVFTGPGLADPDLVRRELASAERRVAAGVDPDRVRRRRNLDAAALYDTAREYAAGRMDPLTARTVARFGLLLRCDVRDELWLDVDDGTLDAAALMQTLFTGLPAPYDAAPLLLFGWQKWRAGNGVLAVMAAERALASDSGYAAAALLRSTVQHGVSPITAPPLRAG